MFKKSDEGKEIIIKNTCGARYLKEGQKVRIFKVLRSDEISIEGVTNGWFANNRDAYQFVGQAEDNLNIGDKIILIQDTTSLKEGDVREILAFLHDDKSKIIVDGVISGGWLSSDKVEKVVDVTKIRFMTCLEIMAKEGITGVVGASGGIKQYANILGKTLSEIGATIKGGVVRVPIEAFKFTKDEQRNYNKYWNIDADMTKNISEQPKEYDIIVSQYSYKRTGNAEEIPKPSSNLFEAAGLDRSEEQIFAISLAFHNQGYFKVNGWVASMENVKVVIKNEDKGKESSVTNLLPF